jgi:GTP-binding protein HflX
MLRAVLLLTLAAAFVPAPKRTRHAPLLGRKRGRGNSKDADDAPKAPKKKKSSGAAAKAAALAEEALAPKPKQAAPDRVTAKQKIQKRRGNDKVVVLEEEETKGRERKKAQDEISPERRELLRGVAAAESAYAAAELLADAVQAENYERDASESAAIEGYFDTSRWPSAVLVGLDLTSRRGASKLAERRTRGADNAGLALCAPVDAGWTVHDSLAELGRLCDTARVNVVDSTYQRADMPNGQFLVGKGKVEDVAKRVLQHKADAIVFDDELSLAQQRSLNKELSMHGCSDDLQILDRTQLVLQIFSERAQTREARAQIALARAEYMLPRLTTFLTTGAGMDSRSGGKGSSGGAYLRGAGESQLEMDRRLFGKRISRLNKELDLLKEKRTQSREKRKTDDRLPLVCLVGYTNAGKTSLLNALAEQAQPLYADDRLFATLDPATRRVQLPSGRACRLTDTVGFLQRLPTKLVASFRATLEEVADACLLLHVVDSSSPLAANQMRAVRGIVDELGCRETPTITIYNKQDLCEDEEVVFELDNLPKSDVDSSLSASATSGGGVDALLEAVDAALASQNALVDCLVPFARGDLVEEVHRTGTVERVEHEMEGTRLVARVPEALANRLKEFLVVDDG